MKKEIVWLFGIIIILNLPLINAEDTLWETQDLNLYGNITIKAPNSKIDENFTFYLPNNGSNNDYGFWSSTPLPKDISLNGDVRITIWAVCDQPRNIAFNLVFQIIEPKGGGYGHGPVTEIKLVHNEPVEFTAIISEEELEENELNTFQSGDRICISVRPVYQSPQQPAEVSILYNSTDHPSHITINTNSISNDLSNSRSSNNDPNNFMLNLGPIFIVGVSTILSSMYLGLTETGRYKFFKYVFVPFYAKIQKKNPLENQMRELIYKYILHNPGENYITIKKTLGLANGTLIYHLNILKREGLVKTIAEGRNNRFYPMKSSITNDHTVYNLNGHHMLTKIQIDILKIISEKPGLSKTEMAQSIGVSRQLFNYHLNKLKKIGILKSKRRQES
jgi:DNA-binding MarR family transcriptional regulator